MKVLVLTGPESSGKSSLADEIRMHLGGQVVGEYVRHFIDQEQRDTCYEDIPVIARGQIAWEDAGRAARPPLLILDTHLLSNMLWSRKLFGKCPAWLESELLARHYDAHFLLSPDQMEWVDDGQRCQPRLADRRTFFNDCRGWLEHHRQSHVVLMGTWVERRAQALDWLENWSGKQ